MKITFDLKNSGGNVTGTVTQGPGQAQEIKNGKLAGYAGGITRKQFLLDLEKSATVQASKLC